MTTERPDQRGGAFTPSMIGLLLTQMLGAFNDNLFRWFAVKAAQTTMDPETALSVGLASSRCLTSSLPCRRDSWQIDSASGT